jgi:hypothetical protein
MVSELKAQHLYSSTVIIITAKHGQTPIDRSKSRIVDKSIIPNIVNSVQGQPLAQATEDDIALLWLKDQSKTKDVVAALNANKAQASIKTVLWGDAIRDHYNNPLEDSRTPDIIALPIPGVIYASPTATKIAEHGGFNHDDTSVAMLVANPHLKEGTSWDLVTTTQIAPSILNLLGISPESLKAVRIEHTGLLPDLGF